MRPFWLRPSRRLRGKRIPQSSALLLDAVHRRFGSERRKQAAARTFEL